MEIGMEAEMKALSADLRSCLRVMKKKSMLIIYISLFSALFGFLLGMNIETDTYEAGATVYCATDISYEQSVINDKILADCEDIATSKAVLQRAGLILGNGLLSTEEIGGMISVDRTEGSSIISISTKTDNSAEAVSVTNAVADSLVIELQNLIGSQSIQLLDRADVAERTMSAKKLRVIIIGLTTVLGCIIPCLICCFSVLLSNRIRSIEDCELGGELKILGVIPATEKR